MRRRRTNLWQRVRFELDGIALERWLVPEAKDLIREISTSSPVGEALLTALPGERIVVQAPGGDVVVKVLEVEEYTCYRACSHTIMIRQGGGER